jgi:tetratricopeptide (TPR) repeat protein
LGTGPSTFVFDYSKFKPREINQTVFWSLKFQKGASEIQDKLITSGILGILSLFFIFFTFLYLSLKNQKENSHLIFSTFFALFLSQFLYPANFSLFFLFWFLLSIFSLSNSKIKILDFSPKISILSSFLFVCLFIFGISLSFTQIRNLSADIRYFQGIKAWQNGKLDQGINFLERAIKLNSDLDLYQRDISQLYLRKLNETLEKKENDQKVQNLTFLSINSAKRATEISKNDVSNWNNLGFIYRNLGVEDQAIDSYQKSIELEPKNPYVSNEMGLIYLAKADLAKAKDSFQKAIDLKPDYLPAYFQLGLLYYNDNQTEKAKNEFLIAISLDENYSNARYFLGLIYDKEGKKDLAIEQFEKIEKLNPESQEVKKILANLKEGKSALEGMTPLPPRP